MTWTTRTWLCSAAALLALAVVIGGWLVVT